MREEVESTDIGLEEDGSGWVLSVFRGDWPFFDGAEMLRVSAIWPNAVSPWCMHGRYTQYLCCMRGTVHLAMHDSREDRESHRETVTEYIGERSPRLVKVPPGVFFGSKNTGNGVALLAIASTGIIDSDDPDHKVLPSDTDEIAHDWSLDSNRLI